MAPSTPSPSAASDPLSRDPRVKRLRTTINHKPLNLYYYHSAGRQMSQLAGDPTLATRGSGWRKRVADLVGTSEATLNKCLQFFRAYTEDEIQGLFQFTDNWARVSISLGVPDKDDRHRLLRQARQGGWSDAEMQHRIQQELGRRRSGGRPRREAKSRGLESDLQVMTDLLQTLDTFLEEVWLPSEREYRGQVGRSSDEERAALLQSVVDVYSRTVKLRHNAGDAHRVAEKLLQTLMPGADR